MMRRAQLVSPFGVGAMSVTVEGTSVLTRGLDKWFEGNPGGEPDDSTEFTIHDWRLEQRLGVSEFRLPPDYRRPQKGHNVPNSKLSIPVARFPTFHHCPACKRLNRSSDARRGSVYCQEHGNSKPLMAQVPFVAFCENGHLNDFPFYEWVHKSTKSECPEALRLTSRGTGLDKQIVSCDACGKKRTLSNATRMYDDGSTYLQKFLFSDGVFSCNGAMPWLGGHKEECEAPPRGGLRGGGNLYFPVVESSIFLPEKTGGFQEILKDIILPNLNIIANFEMAISLGREHLGYEDIAHSLKKVGVLESTLCRYSPEDWERAYEEFSRERRGDDGAKTDENLARDTTMDPAGLVDLERWRYPEYLRLREVSSDPSLRTRDPGVPHQFAEKLCRVRAVDSLTETRVLRGFLRGSTNAELSLERGKSMLRAERSEDWLPGYVVQGEGVFLEFDLSALVEWEERSSVRSRIAAMERNILNAHDGRGVPPPLQSPRFVMIHTFAHLLINQLVFECGYSTASLRERLYVSSEKENEMAGVLVYTAAGDSDGTLGGLVGMSKRDRLGDAIESALSDANWCSVDPVCMESGSAGQGPGSCNMAACHSCALVPETSCEEFNRYLDRALVVGSFHDADLGFF